MTREEPKFFLTDIRDFTTLFYVILRRKSSEWLQTSTESDWYAICNMEPGLSHSRFAFFKHCCYCKNRSLKRVFYLLIFVNRENEIVMSVSRHSLFFLFVNRARDPPPPPLPCTTLITSLRPPYCRPPLPKLCLLAIFWLFYRPAIRGDLNFSCYF